MPRKPTITRDSVFGRRESTIPIQGIKDEKSKATQTAVWLNEEETNWIDDRCTEIKRSGWKGVTRSAFIRAAIQVLMERKLDLEGIDPKHGEEQLKDRITISQ